MAHGFSGAGPGVQTPDGCSVEFYRQLPYLNELSDIEPELITHRSALELGCGTVRLCRRLRQLGLQVAGVDESAAMLALLPSDVEGIESRIEQLNLGRTWPAVLLPSHLINHPDDSVRRCFVEAANRHIEPSGVFYIERHSTQWLSTVQDGLIGEFDGVTYFAENVRREVDLVTMTLRYAAFGQSWIQHFTTRALEKVQIESLLASCGFGNFRWFGQQELWVAASPCDS